jgi:hypothetical protein
VAARVVCQNRVKQSEAFMGHYFPDSVSILESLGPSEEGPACVPLSPNLPDIHQLMIKFLVGGLIIRLRDFRGRRPPKGGSSGGTSAIVHDADLSLLSGAGGLWSPKLPVKPVS